MLKRALILTALSISAQAATILVDNLAESTRATTVVDMSLWAAQSFDTDGNSYSLVNIMTVLGNSVGAPSVVAELRKDTTTGTLLTTFSVPSLAGPLSVTTLTPNSSTTLDPNTTFWLILSVPGTGSFGWSYAEGNSSVGQARCRPTDTRSIKESRGARLIFRTHIKFA